MKKSDTRQKYILDKIFEHGFVSIADITKELGVSDETVRRDINALAERNLLRKVRTGAETVRPSFRRDVDYIYRLHHNQKQKKNIGLKAAQMIKNNTVVGLDCGVSVQSIAASISGVENVIFVTNSLPVAVILLQKIQSSEISGKLIFVGGEMDLQNRFSKGATSIDMIGRFHFDIAFVSCTAVASDGIFSYSLDECAYSSRLVANSHRTVLVAESDKLSKYSLYKFADFSDIDDLIVDDIVPIPHDLCTAISNENVALVVVPDKD